MLTGFTCRFPNAVLESAFKIPQYHLSQAAVRLWEKEIVASRTRAAIKSTEVYEGKSKLNWKWDVQQTLKKTKN